MNIPILIKLLSKRSLAVNEQTPIDTSDLTYSRYTVQLIDTKLFMEIKDHLPPLHKAALLFHVIFEPHHEETIVLVSDLV